MIEAMSRRMTLMPSVALLMLMMTMNPLQRMSLWIMRKEMVFLVMNGGMMVSAFGASSVARTRNPS